MCNSAHSSAISTAVEEKAGELNMAVKYFPPEVTHNPLLFRLIGQSGWQGLAEEQEAQFPWRTREGGIYGTEVVLYTKTRTDSGKQERLVTLGEVRIGEQ